MKVLHVRDLALARGDRLLFEGLNLCLRAGEAMMLTGENGAGKTSLLRAISGLLRPVTGDIDFEDENGRLDPVEARCGALHFLGHQDGLKTSRTARQELDFQVRWTGGGADGLAHAIDVLGLSVLLDLDVRMLSAGQRRKLALARLIASPRPLWLLDEPMAPLDAARRAIVGELMEAHLEGGGMILAAVHDPLPIPAGSLEVVA